MTRSAAPLSVLAVSLVAGCLWMAGCAADPPKPVPQQEIRSHADQFNEKMKQEERERGKGPGGPMP
jgi:hypothetical protein